MSEGNQVLFRRTGDLLVLSPRLQPIVSVERWGALAAPLGGAAHFVDDRSAKELAKAWLATGNPREPQAMKGLFDGCSLTRSARIATVLPEWRTDLRDGFPGPRRHDALLLGSVAEQTMLVGVEAKTDEPFDQPLAGRVRMARRMLSAGKRTNQLARAEALVKALLGRELLVDGEVPVDLASIPYQLLSGLAGTLIETETRGADIAVFVVHAFRHDRLDIERLGMNERGFGAFVSAVARARVDPVDGVLVGPFRVPGGPSIPGRDVLIGATTTLL